MPVAGHLSRVGNSGVGSSHHAGAFTHVSVEQVAVQSHSSHRPCRVSTFFLALQKPMSTEVPSLTTCCSDSTLNENLLSAMRACMLVPDFWSDLPSDAARLGRLTGKYNTGLPLERQDQE